MKVPEQRVIDELMHRYEQLAEQEKLPPRESLQKYYSLFRDHFGPDRLSRLDGEELLNTIHAHGSRDSLVYWLEFKNDDELPDFFGSIAGGSALKFGIYRRKETQAWMIDRGSGQEEISVAEAVTVARTHRDQLVAGAEKLVQFAPDTSDEHYARLQDQMNSVAPKVSDTAWGHKYFSILFPEKIDDFHVEEFQRFYIRKMLEVPPEREGRYAAAGRYVATATQMRIPMNHLAATLKSLYGRPYKVWRIGTRLGGTDSIWDLMRSERCIAIGWPSIGDLSGFIGESDARERIRKHLADEGDSATVAGRSATQVLAFASRIAEGDLVLAADGEQILAIGRVTGAYQYDPSKSAEAPHRRPVEWADVRPWRLPHTEGLQSTVREVKKFPENLVAIERRLFHGQSNEAQVVDSRPARAPLRPLDTIPARIQMALERKGQVVLYGPPGTGKTHWAYIAALELASRAAFGKTFEDLSADSRREVTAADGLVRTCTFHPAYGYEDFIEGYRPTSTKNGELSFKLTQGIFKRLCRDAEAQSHRAFYLLIDEINRGDIPRIFGELITLLESDKRGRSLQLPVSGASFSVPKNVYVIGTMNTADRSIALLDTALRRRFGFIELMPDTNALGNATVANSIPLSLWLSGLNGRIRRHIRRDARNLQVGHAYLMDSGRPVTDLGKFTRILAEDIIPLIEEYCYEDFAALREVLGAALINEDEQRVRTELFLPERRDDLVQALLALSPEITTSAAAIAAERAETETERDEAAE